MSITAIEDSERNSRLGEMYVWVIYIFMQFNAKVGMYKIVSTYLL